MHAENVARDEGAELVAVASGPRREPPRLRPGWGRACKHYQHEDLAAADDVEAVVLCCSGARPCAAMRCRCSRRASIFSSKNLARRRWSITIAFAPRRRPRSDSMLQIGYMRRFDPLFSEAHRLVTAGAIGEPLVSA